MRLNSSHGHAIICVGIFSAAYIAATPSVSAAANAAPVIVFGLGQTPPAPPSAGLRGILYKFDESGTLENEVGLPETQHAISMITDGSYLYAAEYEGAIERYSLDGAHLGQVVDIGLLPGGGGQTPHLEIDHAGDLYHAFGGSNSTPRTSFRLTTDGQVLAAYSHPDLVFPNGIDATANGDVYVVNGANVGVGDRLFRFDSSGVYIDDYAIPEVQNPSDLAINEATRELYLADYAGNSIVVYDLTTGIPIFGDSIAIPGNITDVFIEQASGRIFGSFSTLDSDVGGVFIRHTGFEASRENGVETLYFADAPPREQRLRAIVAIAIPEPVSLNILSAAAIALALRCRRVAK